MKKTNKRVKADTVCTEIRQGKLDRLAGIGVRLGKMKVFVLFSLSVSLLQTHTHDTVRATISYEYICAGYTQYNIEARTVHKYTHIMLNPEIQR